MTNTFDRKKIIERRQCIEQTCQRMFGITAGEMEFFTKIAKDDSGSPLPLPKRCLDCRRRRKQMYEKEN